MLEYALLACLLCLVAIPAITSVGINAEETLDEVASSLEVAEQQVVDPLARWNGGPVPFEHGSGWHAVRFGDSLVVPQGASGTYIVYQVFQDGGFVDVYHTQNASGAWTQHPPGVNPAYPTVLMGGAGEGITFEEMLPWLPR